MSVDNQKLKTCPKITGISVTEDRKLRIQWTEVADADKYSVRRCNKSNGEYEHIAWTKEKSYVDKSVQENVTYWYRIMAQKDLLNKKKSKKISPFAAGVVSSMAAPTDVRAGCNSKGKIRLTWTAPENIKEFIINRRNDFFDQIIPVDRAQGNKYIDKDIVSGQIYHYSVQSADGEKQGNFSSEVLCVSLDCGELVSVRATRFKGVVLRARIVAGADGYIFERSEDGENFTEAGRTETGVSLDFTDKVPRMFAYYFYRVRTFKKVGNTLFESGPSPSVKVKSK